MRNLKPILLVEDDDTDVMIIEHVFADLEIRNELICAGDGSEALEHLRNVGDQVPCLILLDLNMPGMDGIEFLREVKADERLKNIPIIAMTGSGEREDKMSSFGLGIAGYIVKPCKYEKFVEAIKTIDRYWTLSELPLSEVTI